MLKWLKRVFFGRDLREILGETKQVRIHGVKFVIRKINPMDYLAGTKSLRQFYSTYQVDSINNVELKENHARDIQSHYSDVFLSCIVDPELKKSKETEGPAIPVDHLFTDWDLANRLYMAVMEFTYGKKKIRASGLLKKES